MKTFLIIAFAIFAVIFAVALFIGLKATKGVERRKLSNDEKAMARARDGHSHGPTDLSDLP